ncbi:hypothetical protein THAOC_13239 [Thalassiosira oceanica]|uniref:Uncharacterized protein n=1 Tax=Thalassiosira oceanica TaxID=159749 RepID=K0T600_THAOC|nr:hypothetical protein THAOC_13239 [Thalassiosira oceanica]|eukprot:EJK65857.1 hypothetical protein THAOC_13239 [Thalassiosira oceanica]
MKCCGRRAIPMALRPPLSIKRAVPAAPRVHRGPSTPPSGPISVLGSSAAPRRHLCRLASHASSDLQIRRRRCRGEHVYKSTFDVANRRLTEARGCGATRLALGTPWFCSFFLGFRRYCSYSRGVGDFAWPGLTTHQEGPKSEFCPMTPELSVRALRDHWTEIRFGPFLTPIKFKERPPSFY